MAIRLGPERRARRRDAHKPSGSPRLGAVATDRVSSAERRDRTGRTRRRRLSFRGRRRMTHLKAAALLLIALAGPAVASEDIADKYPGSLLYNKPVEVIPHVWSAIGATAPPTYENAGHNNNLSFIVTGDGVVVINGGAAYGLAKALHDEIKQITDQPVKLVFNENGQGHAMLGNGYWADQGVPIVAHEEAAAEFEEYGGSILSGMEGYNRDRAEGTFVQGPTETFADEYIVEMGDFRIEAR